MRINVLTFASSFSLLLLIATVSNAQTNPDAQQGISPYASLAKGEIDNVVLGSGNLFVNIPLLSYPQRGHVLNLNFDLRSTNKGWTIQQPCSPQFACPKWMMNGTIPSVFAAEEQGWSGGVEHSGNCNKGGSWSFLAYGPTGESHEEYVTNGSINTGPCMDGSTVTLYTTDGTGVRYVGPNNGPNYSGDGKTAVMTDRSGIRYYLGNTTGVGTHILREDSNGNQISNNILSNSAIYYKDTMGRTIPFPPDVAFPQASANPQDPSTDSSGCTGPLPISWALLWSVPGPQGGVSKYKLCYVTIVLLTNFKQGTVAEGGSTGSIFLQSVVLPNGNAWTLEYNSRGPGDPQTVNYGDLTKITFPTGGTITYTYENFQFCYTDCGTYGSMSRAVATRTVDANDGTGPHTWTYTWGPKGTSGTTVTMQVTVTDPLGNDTVYQMAAFDFWRETQAQSFQGGHSTGTLLKTVNTDWTPWNPTQQGLNPQSVLPIRVTTTWANNSVAKVETDYDFSITWTSGSTASFGDVIAKRDYDYGTGSPGSLIRQIKTTYMAMAGPNATSYLRNNLLSLPYTVQTQNGSGTQYASTQYGYDESSLGNSGVGSTEQHNTAPAAGIYRGNQTSVLRWLNSGTLTCQNGHSAGTGSNVTGKITYFDTGTVQTSADPCGNTATFAYSNTYWGAYPTTVTNPLSQVTTHVYDFNIGLITSTTDPNNLVTSYTYDSMWRVASVAHPDSGTETINHQESSFPFTATHNFQINLTATKSETNVFDGLGRVTQHQLTTDPQGTVYSDTTYDALGRVSTVSNPHRTCGTDLTSSCGITTYGYDALTRKTSESYPDGSVLKSTYCGPSTLVTDPTKRWRRSRVDGLGRLVEVDEPNSTSAQVNSNGCPGSGEATWVTTYTVDPLGNLTNVLQNGSHARSFTYDSLSRLQCSSNPESATAACPAFGATTFPNGTLRYVYNPDGVVVTKTDARNLSTNYTYDPLHRELTRTYPNGDPTVTTAYDQSGCLGLSACQNIGQRTSVNDGAGSESWAYEVDKVNSRTVHVDQRTTSSVTKTSTYYLDLGGNVTKVVYPTGRTVNYTYDTASRPSSAADSSNGITYATGFRTSPGSSCISNVTCYTTQGSVFAVSIGQTSTFSGLNVTNGYNNRLQPGEFKASSTGGSAIDIAYSYIDSLNGGNSGHVFTVTNNLDSSRSQGFTYDQVNRILSAGTNSTTGSNCWGYQYSYDAWGNLTSQAGWTPNYNGCTQTVLSGVTPDGSNHISAFGYDLAGNATSDGTYIYAWDTESRLKSAGGVNYTYDGDGRRVSKVGSKLYWYGSGGQVLAETDASGNTLNEYVFFGGKRIAMLIAGGAAQFYVEDSLGSSRIITSNMGVVCYDADFYPYGGERTVINTCTQNNYKFEGKERDTETGNDDFGARYYSWRFGRWLSADWSDLPAPVPYANLTNPQTLNLYSMVADDPESFDDLDGHAETADQEKPLASGLEWQVVWRDNDYFSHLYNEGGPGVFVRNLNQGGSPQGGQPQLVLVATSDTTNPKYPATRNVTYAVYVLQDGELFRIQGKNEILLFETYVRGSSTDHNICAPCSNKDTPNLEDYKEGRLHDENSVQFGKPYAVDQNFTIKGRDALVFRPEGSGGFIGSYILRVSMTPASVVVSIPQGAYTFALQ